MMFADRVDAGRHLASKMDRYRGDPHAVLLALPRGGVVVAREVALSLGLPLDCVVSRKIGAPLNPECAIGAITEDGEVVFDEEAVRTLDISQEFLAREIEKERAEAERRLRVYRRDRPPLDLTKRTAILVDDGIATGLTMRAAIQSARKCGASKVVVAVPVLARDTLGVLQQEANEVIYVEAPFLFGAVGAFYESFPQTSDEEVVSILGSVQGL